MQRNEIINNCVIDSARLSPLRECMECCGPEDPTDEWNHSLIHPNTVAYSCGQLSCAGTPHEHNHDSEELFRCRRLADEAAQIIGETSIYLSESFNSKFEPFFITVNREMDIPPELSPKFIDSMFGGVIYPKAQVIVEPFLEGNLCWEHFVGESNPKESLQYDRNDDEKEFWQRQRQRIEVWQKLFDWFESQDELHSYGFVMIGIDENQSETNFGCVFPRLVLSVTQQGSVVGICSHAVHT